MNANQLYVVTPYSNPMGWKNRAKVQEAYEKAMLASGVNLLTVECATGERPFELPPTPGVTRVQVRAKTLMWNKECLINLGVSRLPDGWKYLAWVDGDVIFRKPSWALDTIDALQRYDVVQPWQDAYDLGPNDEHLQAHKSFCSLYWEGKPVVADRKNFWKFDGGYYDYAHSGYAWACHRQAYEWMGGLIDFAAMGAGDHHMALGLVGRIDASVPYGITDAYFNKLKVWQDRVQHHINGRLGFVYGTIEHQWHGRKTDRRYVDRWQILVKYKFDPNVDIKRNSYGVYELAGNKPQMELEMDRYYRGRNEDANTIT